MTMTNPYTHVIHRLGQEDIYTHTTLKGDYPNHGPDELIDLAIVERSKDSPEDERIEALTELRSTKEEGYDLIGIFVSDGALTYIY